MDNTPLLIVIAFKWLLDRCNGKPTFVINVLADLGPEEQTLRLNYLRRLSEAGLITTSPESKENLISGEFRSKGLKLKERINAL